MKWVLLFLGCALLFVFFFSPTTHRVCDNEKRERLIMECLERTPQVTNAGEDVNLGGAVWPCQRMADELSCWMEKEKGWLQR